MGKNSKRKALHSKKEEQQGKRVMVILGVAAFILMLLFMTVFAYWA